MEIIDRISEAKRQEILLHTLENTPLHVFNAATREYSVSRIYYHQRNYLMSKFKDVFEGSQLWFSIIMTDIFRPYKLDEIECSDRAREMNKLMHEYKLFPKYHPRKDEAATKYNELVEVHNKAMAPQNQLIKMYRKIRRQQLKDSLKPN